MVLYLLPHAGAGGRQTVQRKCPILFFLISMVLSCWMLLAMPLMAQTGQAQHFSIAAQPLAAALDRFSRQTGIAFAYTTSQFRQVQSPGVTGTLTPRQALVRLLADTGVNFKFTGAATVVLERNVTRQDKKPLRLAPVNVKAESMQESAYGPVEGYVAKRSATATKTDTPIIETPQSISIISREDMDIRNVRDTGDVVAYSSGVLGGTAGEKNLFGGSSIRIRGYGYASSSGRSDNLHIDGLRVTGTGYLSNNLDPWLFERIEVLKGPSSVLFGQTHPGGIINQISKRPHDGMYNQIRFGSGNFDKASVMFDLGAELNEAWQLRIVGLGLDGETQQIYGERERYLIAPSLRWTNGATDLTLLMHYQHDDMNAGFYNHAPRAAVFGNPNGRLPLSFRAGDPSWDLWDAEIRSIGYLFSHQFNDDLAFRQNLRYTYRSLKARRSWHNRPLDSSQRILARLNIEDRENIDDVTVDNRNCKKFCVTAFC